MMLNIRRGVFVMRFGFRERSIVGVWKRIVPVEFFLAAINFIAVLLNEVVLFIEIQYFQNPHTNVLPEKDLATHDRGERFQSLED